MQIDISQVVIDAVQSGEGRRASEKQSQTERLEKRKSFRPVGFRIQDFNGLATSGWQSRRAFAYKYLCAHTNMASGPAPCTRDGSCYLTINGACPRRLDSENSALLPCAPSTHNARPTSEFPPSASSQLTTGLPLFRAFSLCGLNRRFFYFTGSAKYPVSTSDSEGAPRVEIFPRL